MRVHLSAASLVVAVVLAAACTGAENGDGVETASPDATSPATTATDATPGTATDATPDATPGTATDTTTDSGTEATTDDIVAAVDATVSQGSARVSTTGSFSGGEASQALSTSGVVDLTGNRQELSVQGPTGPLEAVIEPQAIYLQLPLPTPQNWLRFTPDGIPTEELGLPGLSTFPLQNPSVNLELLRGVSGDVTTVGTEDVAGTSTTHYSVTVDVGQAVTAARPEVQPALEALQSQIGVSELPMEVWIDEENLIRRIGQSGEVSLAGAQGAADVEVEFAEFGVTPDITAPADSEILDVDPAQVRQMLEQLSG